MDQVKIGKFIQELRKEKELTQQELANLLNITDRAISKWENGRGLPDLSLIKPLCEALDISINELLSGERLNKKEYQEKLEENIVNTIDYSNKEIKDIKSKIKTIVIIICTILSLIIIDTFQAIIFKNSPLISWQDELSDADSHVDRGLLIDVYYCVKEQDIVTINWKLKGSKFDCPIDKVKYCPLIPSYEPPMEFTPSKTMSMTIKEGTLTNKGVTVIIKDTGEEKETFGEGYRIDIYENNEWKQLEVIIEGNYGWNLIGYLVGENGIREMKVNWQWLYGELKTGHYRLVKSISPTPYQYEYFYVEFDI